MGCDVIQSNVLLRRVWLTDPIITFPNQLRFMLQKFVIAFCFIAGFGMSFMELSFAQEGSISSSKEPVVIAPGEINGLFPSDMAEGVGGAKEFRSLRTLAVDIPEKSRDEFLGAVQKFGLRHSFEVQIEEARHDTYRLWINLSRKDALIAGGNDRGSTIFQISFYVRGSSDNAASKLQVVQSLFEALRVEVLAIPGLRVMN